MQYLQILNTALVIDSVINSLSCHLFQGLFKNSDEYRIINEMVLFYRPSMKQLSDAFKIPSTPKMNPFSEAITAEDQKCMLIVLHDLTGLLPSWCKK